MKTDTVRLRTIRRMAILAALAIGLDASAASAQVLQQVEQDVRNGDSSGGTSNSPSNSQSSGGSHRGSSSSDADDDGCDPSLIYLCADLSFRVITIPYWLPANMIGDDLNTGYFLRYPYWDDMPGSMFIPEPGGRRYRQWDGEAAVEYANDLDDLSRLGIHLRISTTSRFDFETNWNSFTEDTHAGRDHLTLGDADVLFRFAQSDVLQFRSGIGANWLDDHDGAYAGFNFRYGAEWYPAKPLAIKSLIDLGEIGKAGMVHARLTVGALYQRWEIFTGYDFRQIGDVRITGPLAGVEFRF